MKKSLVAIVGRPNVGKSTFFNRVVGRRISIVEDTPGVTRDRIYADAEWAGKKFTIVDTGGLDFSGADEMQKSITEQAEIAIDLADVVIFFVDGSQGLVTADLEASEVLRRTKKPIIVAVNKLDNFEVEKTYDFYNLGLGEVFALSSLQARGVGDILDAVIANFPQQDSEEDENAPLKIAIVGKPNAGKSSITNRLLGENRVVVSNVAGTTRDSIEVPFKCNKKDYILVDTAGMRKKSNIEDESIELYSVMRSLDAIRRADVVLIVIDAEAGIAEQDLKIASYVNEQLKPSVIVMNKWDLIEKNSSTINRFNEKLDKELAFMSYYKAIYISALTGTRTGEIMKTVETVYENAGRRITTGTLNDLLHEAFSLAQPPSIKGRRLKLLYATQAGTNPPEFVLFVNDASLAKPSYVRYIENFIRKTINFEGTPIKITLKSRAEK